MAKPSLLYASPLPPARSGIADYSGFLLNSLAEFFDITLYTGAKDSLVPALSRFPVVRHGSGDTRFDAFDHCLYQIGNNPWYHGYIYEACLRHPGWVVL